MRTRIDRIIMGMAVSAAFFLFAGARAETGENQTVSINNPSPAQAKTTKDDKAAQETKAEQTKPSAQAASEESPDKAGQPAKKTFGVRDADGRLKAEPGAPEAKGKKFGPGVTKVSKIGEEKSSMGVSPLKFIFALVVIGLLMGGFFFVMKKAHGRISGTTSSGMTVKSRVQLDGKNSVVLLRVYEQEMVIGSGPNGLSLLAKLSPIDELEGDDKEPHVANNVAAVGKKDKISFVETLKGMSIGSVELPPVGKGRDA